MQRLLLVLFMLTVALAPAPLGSNRDWLWSPLASIVGLLLLGCAGLAWYDRGWHQHTFAPFAALRVPAALFALVVAWALVQISGWTPAGWASSISARETLGLPAQAPSIAFDREQQWTALLHLLTYAGVFVLAAALASKASDGRRILGAIVVVSVLMTLYAMAAKAINLQAGYTGLSLWVPSGVFNYFTGTLVNGNNYATYAGMATLTALALAFRPASRQERMEPLNERVRRWLAVLSGMGGFWFALALILITGVLFSGSRAGATSLALGLLALIAAYTRGPTRIVLAVSVPLLLAAVVLLAPMGGPLIEKASRLIVHGESGREALFPMTLKAIAVRPLTGWGLNSFGDLYGVFQPPQLQEYFDKAHNTYLELAFDLGIPMAMLLLLAVALIVWRCLIGFATRGRERELAGAGVLVTVLVGFHALFDFSLQIPGVACIYFAILGVAWAQSWSGRLRTRGMNNDIDSA